MSKAKPRRKRASAKAEVEATTATAESITEHATHAGQAMFSSRRPPPSAADGGDGKGP